MAATQTFEDAGKFGKDYFDNSVKSFAAFSKGAQAIVVETTDYTKKSVEAGTAAFEKLLGAKSLEKAIEIQTDYAKTAYEGFVAQATRTKTKKPSLYRVLILNDDYTPNGVCRSYSSSGFSRRTARRRPASCCTFTITASANAASITFEVAETKVTQYIRSGRAETTSRCSVCKSWQGISRRQHQSANPAAMR
jgi:ATP-dependent Clp protease adapter protein ClpS